MRVKQEQLLWTKRPGLGSQARVSQDLLWPWLQASSCGPSGWSQPICWLLCLVSGQQDRVLQVVFYSNDQNKTNSDDNETPNVRLRKICHHISLIQDFSASPNPSWEHILLKLYIAELFAMYSIEMFFFLKKKSFLNRLE